MEKKFDVTRSYPSKLKTARCDIACGGKEETIWFAYFGNTNLKRVDVACMVMPVIRDDGLTVIHGDHVDTYFYHGADTVVVWEWEVAAADSDKVALSISALSKLFDDTLGELEDAE